MARIDEHWAAHRHELEAAARQAGVDVGLLVQIAGFESGFNPDARPVSRAHPELNTVRQFDGTLALSSAHGYGQFLDSTWQQMLNRHGHKYGVELAGQLGREQANAAPLRRDTRLQAAMLAEFTAENVQHARQYPGHDLAASVYALHNLGHGDGSRFLQALQQRPQARVDSVLGARVIAGNAGLYADGSLSVAEAHARMGRQMQRFSRHAGQALANAEPALQAATEPGNLQLGQQGTAVRQLQEQLARLGHVGSDGQPLRVDGHFGAHTLHAVEDFQREQGLRMDGIAGPRTLARLAQPLQLASATAPAPAVASHPQAGLYQAALQQLQAHAGTAGPGLAVELPQLAAAVARHAHGAGLHRIDHVLPSSDGQGWIAVQGALDDPAMRRVRVENSQALPPLEQALRQLQQEPGQLLPQLQPAEPRLPML